MRPDQDLFSQDYLQFGFTLSALWGFRDELVEVKNKLEHAKSGSDYQYMDDNQDIDMQLNYLEQNIDRIEFVMVLKEIEITMFGEYENICMN